METSISDILYEIELLVVYSPDLKGFYIKRYKQLWKRLGKKLSFNQCHPKEQKNQTIIRDSR